VSGLILWHEKAQELRLTSFVALKLLKQEFDILAVTIGVQ
jgi:hypothetical protein